MTADLRALTIRQPWADAITHGPKRTENRSRPTPAKHVGSRILIHAGTAYDPMGRFMITDWDALAAWPDTRGAIIASARLVDCHQANPAGILCCAPWGFPDAWHWELADVRALSVPVPCRGQLGLWGPPDEVVRAVLVRRGERRSPHP